MSSSHVSVPPCSGTCSTEKHLTRIFRGSIIQHMMNNAAAELDAVVVDGLRVRRGHRDVFDGLSVRIPRGQ